MAIWAKWSGISKSKNLYVSTMDPGMKLEANGDTGYLLEHSEQPEELSVDKVPAAIRTLVEHSWGHETPGQMPHRHKVTS